jgi:hypothetical protein
MANCGCNTLIIGRPTREQAAQACGPNCGDGGFPCPDDIGPRRNRERTREQIKDHIQLILGAPTIQLELDQQQLDHAVDLALDVFEDYAPREYFQYYVFNATPGRSVYKMPPDVGIVRNIFYKTTPQIAFSSHDLDGALPLDYFYPGGGYGSVGGGGMIDPTTPIWGHMGEWVLYKQYEQMYANISSQTGGWEWLGDMSTIKLYPTPFRNTSVIVHYLQKCKDWGKSTQAMREGALAYAKIMLGRVRSKYSGTFGPANSGLTLDGVALLQEGNDELKQWKEDLIYRYGEILPITLH